MPEKFDIAIVGSGPAGVSAAARAAERGLSHVLLESCPHLSNTIYRYQKGKHVMDEPGILPLRSPLPFKAGSREEILGAWDSGVAKLKTNVWHSAEVKKIAKSEHGFDIALADGRAVVAKHVVLAIGVQGNLRKMGIPGEDADFVQYQLDDPDEYQSETIVVVGAGDAAIENAIALARNNQVIIVNRRDEFARAKEGNLNIVLKAIQDGTMQCYYGTSPESLVPTPDGKKAGRLTLATPKGNAVIEVDRIIARLGANPPRAFVESCGIVFPNKDPASVPAVSTTYESNVPGLYIIGALGGYPLIKQAMNQGYEVVETILGNKVEPADEPLLRDKFKAMPGFKSVDDTLDLIQTRLPLLAPITRLQLREFLLDSGLKVLPVGETVFVRNDYTTTFFSILSGQVEIFLDDTGSKRVSLKQGEFFGEMSLISGRRRSATVVAGPDCVLLETPRRSMNRLLQSVDAVKRRIDEVFVERALRSRFGGTIAKEQLTELVSGAKAKRIKAGERLFSEGDEADGLHLVRIGSLTVSRDFGGKEVTLAYLPAGNYVGEMALFGEGTRSATATAAIASETVCIERVAFQSVMKRNPLLAQQVQREYKQRLAQNLATQAAGSGGSDIISFLVSQGVGEATDILLIDESLCVRCDNCEKACAETHGGTSRLDREAGPTFANVHVPTSCRHCEHPHCMKDCPPDAIHRAPNGEVFIADNCIGCGNCERNCPYGVIHMSGPKDKKPGLWSWLLLGLGSGPGEAPKSKGKSEKKAVKCDMCKDLKGGAACVRACPTGAAIRIHPEQLPQYALGRR